MMTRIFTDKNNQVVKERLPRVELSLPRERRVGLYTMIFKNRDQMNKMIQFSVRKVLRLWGLQLFSRKMERFWAL